MAAQKGVMTIMKQGVVYPVQFYLDDTATNLVRWDSGAGAGASSATHISDPYGFIIKDICIAAATGQTQTSISINGKALGAYLLNAVHLASITNRPQLHIPVAPNTKLEMIQVA